MILDLFAGPGGWDEGLRMIGRPDVVGVEWDESACLTAEAAGHKRIRADVAALDPAPFSMGAAVCDLLGIDLIDAIVEGLIASPPCQAWSMAGKRKGELDRANCHTLAARMADGDDSTDWTTWADDRSPLVCQPIRWIRELRPEWVALEEVPLVAPLWKQFAHILRGWGYSAWTGDLLAADYGVPQRRLRRILMAHKTMRVHPPMPTHAKHPQGDSLFGPALLPWVSMADALGRGFEDEPSCTVSAGGGASGGPEPFANAGYRRRLVEYVNGKRDPQTKAHYRRDVAEPSPTLTGGLPSWTFQRPATTVVGSFRPDIIAGPGHHDGSRQDAPGSVKVAVEEIGVLQSFPADYPWTGSKTKQFEQAGNAVPPLLAAHVLAALGVGELPEEVTA